jgi:hypothetical protein
VGVRSRALRRLDKNRGNRSGKKLTCLPQGIQERYDLGMAQASSVTTYLDVAQAAAHAVVKGELSEDPSRVAAAVLAAIHGGSDDLGRLVDSTHLSLSDLTATLASLDRAGLIVLSQRDGVLRASLTADADAALSSS